MEYNKKIKPGPIVNRDSSFALNRKIIRNTVTLNAVNTQAELKKSQKSLDSSIQTHKLRLNNNLVMT